MKENKLTTTTEGLIVVNDGDIIIAVIRRDPTSRKHLVYKIEEMGSEDIAKLINPNFSLKKNE